LVFLLGVCGVCDRDCSGDCAPLVQVSLSLCHEVIRWILNSSSVFAALRFKGECLPSPGCQTRYSARATNGLTLSKLGNPSHTSLIVCKLLISLFRFRDIE